MPKNERLYLGTNDGLRVLARSDSGEPWTLETIALDNAPVTAIRPAPDETGDLLCAVGVWGVWRCDEDARKFQELNQGLSNREIHALAVSSDGLTLYAGAAPPNVYRSRNTGESWEELESFDQIPSHENWFYPLPPGYPNIRHIVAHPTDPHTAYVGVEIGGLFRTSDGGETWEDLTGTTDPDCHAIGLHPERPDRILISTPRGPFVSQDNGQTWTQCWKGQLPSYSASVAVCPDQPDTILVAISRGFRGGEATLWRTEDGAETWQPAGGDLSDLIPSQIRGALAYSRYQPQAAYAGSLAGDLFESRDGGRNWAVAFRGLPPVRSLYAP